MNAQCLGMNHQDLTYVEGRGLYFRDFEHGWCIDADGNLVDPTWAGRRGRTPGTAYFGVPLAESYVMQVIENTRYYDRIINDNAFSDLAYGDAS